MPLSRSPLIPYDPERASSKNPEELATYLKDLVRALRRAFDDMYYEVTAPAQGAYGVVLDPNLYPPLEPYLFVNMVPRGDVLDIKFRCKYRVGPRGRPHGIALCYAYSLYRNRVRLGDDNGTELIISEAEFYDVGQCGPILEGSTRQALVIATRERPLPVEDGVDLSPYWAQFSTSQWRKCSWYNYTTLYFDEPFDIDPVIGAMVNYRASAWVDNRLADYRFLYGENTSGAYEIVKWGGIAQVSNPPIVKFINCERGREGTTQLNLANSYVYYYPAIGPGSYYLIFPLSDFRKEGDFYVIDSTVSANQPRSVWGSVSCLAYLETAHGYARSYIVPCKYGGMKG
jgi:hypothetical protein